MRRIISFVVAVVLTIVGLILLSIFLPPVWAWWFAVVAVIVLAVMLVTWITISWAKWLVVCVAAALVLTSLGFGIWDLVAAKPSNRVPATASTTTAPATVATPATGTTAPAVVGTTAPADGTVQAIAIATPSGSMPRVFRLTGTGDIPAGQQLVAFVWAPGANCDSTVGCYFTDGNATVTASHTWAVPQVIVGSTGTDDVGSTFTVVVVLASNAQAAANTTFHNANPDAGYPSGAWNSQFGNLPIQRIQVTRTGT